MLEPELFDAEHVVIGKTFAKSVGIVSEREMESFFCTIEGDRNWDWFYVSNGVRVVWCLIWDAVKQITAHTTFQVMPVECIPAAVLSDRFVRYDAIPGKPVPSSAIGGNWFDKYTQKQTDESDLEFEHRMVKTLIAVFRTIRRERIKHETSIHLLRRKN
jgi:hypothetical protein